MPRIVVDTSIVINGEIVRMVRSGELDGCEIVIPEAVIDELQAQASQKQEQGFVGLEEIKKIKESGQGRTIRLIFSGQRPSAEDVRLADRGRIDAMIKDEARHNDAVLYTSDRVQSLVAEAEGIPTRCIMHKCKDEELEFVKFFGPDTMSVHLKEGMRPKAKRGTPGAFELAEVGDETLTRDRLHQIATQIVEAARSGESEPEIDKPGALVVQYRDYRIAMTQPPFSEGYEITIVHPVAKLSLEDYDVSEKLMARFADRAEGVLVAGPPGSGKSTLASGLANFYHNMGKIVKTFESPRDLQVGDGITQYTKLDGSFENTADVLLLVRPDYTIFDEVRRREDFGTFSDLRLTGVGMIGVVHANSPVDAVQRFIGKVELGIIPSVLDTVIFVKDGRISKVYDLKLKVKVPSGMTEQDLARPVIEISNFEDGVPEYEIYTFGEENVIVPVTKETRSTGMQRLAAERIGEVFRRMDPSSQVEATGENSVRVTADKRRMASIIGRGGSNITEVEKKLGVHIDVVAREAEDESYRVRDETDLPEGGVPFTFSESKVAVILAVDRHHSGLHVDVTAGGEHVASARIGRKGQIRLPRRSEAARRLLKLARSQEDIQVRPRDS